MFPSAILSMNRSGPVSCRFAFFSLSKTDECVFWIGTDSRGMRCSVQKAIVQQLAFALSVVSHRGRSLNSKISQIRRNSSETEQKGSYAREEYRARKVRPASFLTAMGNAGPYVASRCRRSSDGRRGPELCGRCLSSQRSMPSLRLREQAPGLRFADSVPAVSWRRHAVLGGDGESGSPARVVRDVLR